MRQASIRRTTAETDIELTLRLEGGDVRIDSGCGFLNHMLTLLAVHGGLGLTLRCKGDTDVDYHHSTEDIGIVLGQAFAQALGDKKGIRRYGDCFLPMDETLVLCSLDLSGRSYLGFFLPMEAQKVGDFDTELVREFFAAFTRSCPGAVHLRLLSGQNTHHIIEAAFKAFGRSLRQAVSIDPLNAGVIPSSKGVL